MKSSLLAASTLAILLALFIVLHPSSVAADDASTSSPEATADKEHKHLRTRHSSPPPRLLASEQELYFNDFEHPSQVPSVGCGGSADISSDAINKYFSKPSFTFQQEHTVEVVLLDGQTSSGVKIFQNPQDAGGKYAIGMWQGQDDKLALSLDTKGFSHLTIGLNLAAANLPRCSGPFRYESNRSYKPKLHVSLVDSGWDFSTSEGITPLDEGDLEGTKSDGETLMGVPFILDWAYDTVSLDSSSKSGNSVTIVFDLQGSVPYAVLDNLLVIGSSSNDEAGIGLPADCGRPYEPSCVDLPGMPNRHICTFCSPECPGEFAERAVLMLRSPFTAIPSYYNWFNTFHKKGSKALQHQKQAPEEEWIQWRKNNIHNQTDEWVQHFSYWVERFNGSDTLFIAKFDDLVNENTGPSLLTDISRFLNFPSEYNRTKEIWHHTIHNRSSAVRRDKSYKPTYTKDQINFIVAKLKELKRKYGRRNKVLTSIIDEYLADRNMYLDEQITNSSRKF